MNQTGIKIGLLGFGTVGQGLYDVLAGSAGLKAEIIRIGVKHREKERRLPMHYFTFDAEAILKEPEVNLIVELIDDAAVAYQIATQALRSGKSVITANKKMIAENLKELIDIQQETGNALLYEASSCGSIPIIRNLEEYYDNELLSSVSGIFNGSSNYILTHIFRNNSDYPTALLQAQQLGFAESDPSLDVGGRDALNKLCIITAHAFGVIVHPDDVFYFGIEKLRRQDIQIAKEKGYEIRLICCAKKINNQRVCLFVLPHFIPQDHAFSPVINEYNAVEVQAAFADRQLFVGKGAGGHPTGAAVMSDISAAGYGYRYEYKKLKQAQKPVYSRELGLELYVRYQEPPDYQLLELTQISEQYQSQDGYRWVVGIASLERLFQVQKVLKEKDVFICSTRKYIE